MESRDQNEEGPQEKMKYLEKIPLYFSLAGSVIYLAGFVVITGYLGRYCIFDVKLLDARYFVAGSITSIYVLIFYYFVWRKISFQFERLERLYLGSPNTLVVAAVLTCRL